MRISDSFGRYDCTYCGMRATCLDHVIPRSFDYAGERTHDTNKQECVPACAECNSLLSNLMYITVADRARFLSDRLQERHRDLLSAPDWREEEYEELSGRLLHHVKSLQTKKKLVRARVDYAKGVAKLVNLTIEGVWASQESGTSANTDES
jgi:hypothetical protein